MRVAIAGAGGMGREALAWLRDARPDVEPVAFFVSDADERPTGADVNLSVVVSMAELKELGTKALVLGIGDCRRRRIVADQAEDFGVAVMAVVHPAAFIGPGVEVGPGAIIAPGSVVSRDVRIGRGTIVNFGAKIGHDCIINDFANLGPGLVMAGSVRVGEGCTLGAGCTILPGLTVGQGATVGAGSVVVNDVDADTTVAGNPARLLTRGP